MFALHVLRIVIIAKIFKGWADKQKGTIYGVHAKGTEVQNNSVKNQDKLGHSNSRGPVLETWQECNTALEVWETASGV